MTPIVTISDVLNIVQTILASAYWVIMISAPLYNSSQYLQSSEVLMLTSAFGSLVEWMDALVVQGLVSVGRAVQQLHLYTTNSKSALVIVEQAGTY